MPWVPHVDPPQMGEQTELGSDVSWLNSTCVFD
jgi:hypothetical protein